MSTRSRSKRINQDSESEAAAKRATNSNAEESAAASSSSQPRPEPSLLLQAQNALDRLDFKTAQNICNQVSLYMRQKRREGKGDENPYRSHLISTFHLSTHQSIYFSIFPAYKHILQPPMSISVWRYIISRPLGRELVMKNSSHYQSKWAARSYR